MLIVLAWWAIAVLSIILGWLLIEKEYLTGCSVFFISMAFLKTIVYIIQLAKH